MQSMIADSKISIIGLSHRSAPVTVRERFPGDREHVLALLRRQAALVDELIFVGTCNRSEWIVAATPSQLDDLRADICLLGHLAPDCWQHFFYAHHDEAAWRHLYRVASGLDSMALGETQILGQLKEAQQFAVEAESVAGGLERLLRCAYGASRKIRAQTRLGEGALSVGSLAVRAARDCVPDLCRRRVALLGAGRLGALVGQHLHKQGVRGARILNRSPQRAADVAGEVDGIALELSHLEATLHWADVVICSTASHQPLIDHALVKRAMAGRQERPLCLIDVAVPRDVAPSVGDIPRVILHNIDQLNQQLHENLRQRESEVPKAEALVEWLVREDIRSGDRDITPLVKALHQRAAAVQEQELERLFRRQTYSDQAQDEIRRATRLIVNRLLHPPLKALHERSDDADPDLKLTLFEHLFDLQAEREPDSGEPALVAECGERC